MRIEQIVATYAHLRSTNPSEADKFLSKLDLS